MSREHRIEVHADWVGVDGPRQVGTLMVRPGRGEELFSFEYDDSWLESGKWSLLDPDLFFARGPQYPPGSRPNFGLFLDSCPDRWGRTLMDRREALRAREESRAIRPLHESDYLLGVHDEQRLGALRFGVDDTFLDDDDEMSAPPMASLRELEEASLRLEERGIEDDPSYGRWLGMLVAPGSSLGGARPKANVVDPDGRLWIAKFPAKGDIYDVGRWEFVTRELAEQAGIQTPRVRSERFGSPHHTYLSQRFDRTGAGRVHFASAMTLLGRHEIDDGAASYLDLAEILIQSGANTNEDLPQLWRRVVFNICVSNTDDHLRNHGFLLTNRGWRLAPAYDMNPNARGNGLALNISMDDNRQDLELATDVAELFRVDNPQETIAEVVSAVKTWRSVASKYGLSASEQAALEPAFRIADGWGPG